MQEAGYGKRCPLEAVEAVFPGQNIWIFEEGQLQTLLSDPKYKEDALIRRDFADAALIWNLCEMLVVFCIGYRLHAYGQVM